MPIRIIVKHRANSSGDPSKLVPGEIAANLVDKKLYVGTKSGVLVFCDQEQLNAALATKAGTAEVQAMISSDIAALVDSAPSDLNTLKELAASLNNDPAYHVTIANLLDTKLDQTQVQALIDASGGGAAHTIEDEGTPVADRASLNFVGAGVQVTDTGGKTEVNIPGASGGGGAFKGATLTAPSIPLGGDRGIYNVSWRSELIDTDNMTTILLDTDRINIPAGATMASATVSIELSSPMNEKAEMTLQLFDSLDKMKHWQTIAFADAMMMSKSAAVHIPAIPVSSGDYFTVYVESDDMMNNPIMGYFGVQILG